MQETVITLTIPPGLTLKEWRVRICRAAMIARYGSVSKCAKAMGVGRPLVCTVYGGWQRSAKIEQMIADLTGLPKDTLFPPRGAT